LENSPVILNLSFPDWLILGVYVVFLVIVAYRIKQSRPSGEESFLLDGRRLTLPSFVATTVSTWYGGILGVGEYTYKHGISNWLVFGVPYYVAALIFALFLAERARRSKMLSIPDQLQATYGKGVSLGGAIYVFVMTVPAGYVLMLGIMLQLMLGWQLAVGVIFATIISTGYVMLGGFRSVVRTDWVQFSLMFIAFIVIFIKLTSTYGGLEFLKLNLPAEYFDWKGGSTAGYIFSWYFIALSALVEPAFYQRCYAARTPQVARCGLLISVLFWICFDFLTTSTGLYARAILGSEINAVHAFPLLADQILPMGIKGLFIVGLITTIMSTIDSASFLAASTLGRDILYRLDPRKWQGKQVSLTRWGLIGSGVLAIIIALATNSIIDIWHRLGSFGTPGLLLPLALSYSQRWKFRPRWAAANLVVVPLIVGLWYVMRSTIGSDAIPWSIQPIFPGILCSVGLLGLDHFTRGEG